MFIVFRGESERAKNLFFLLPSGYACHLPLRGRLLGTLKKINKKF
jgi:hypothetical protein